MIKNRFKLVSFKSFKIVKLNNRYFINIPTPTISTIKVYNIKYYQITKPIMNKLLPATYTSSKHKLHHEK